MRLWIQRRSRFASPFEQPISTLLMVLRSDSDRIAGLADSVIAGSVIIDQSTVVDDQIREYSNTGYESGFRCLAEVVTTM